MIYTENKESLIILLLKKKRLIVASKFIKENLFIIKYKMMKIGYFIRNLVIAGFMISCFAGFMISCLYDIIHMYLINLYLILYKYLCI